MLRIYLTNLGKYNEGYLVGEWVSLPASEEELEAVKKRIGINSRYEEWFITDYETDIDGIEVSEYSNIEALNDLAAMLDDMDENEREIVGALLSEGYSVDKAMDAVADCYIWFDCSDMEEVARQYVDSCGMLDGLPDNLANYFDFAAFGRDMSFEAQFIFLKSGNCVEIF